MKKKEKNSPQNNMSITKYVAGSIVLGIFTGICMPTIIKYGTDFFYDLQNSYKSKRNYDDDDWGSVIVKKNNFKEEQDGN